MQKNLEQIRAAAALPVADRTSKADVNRLPAMIISNGLLAATTFAIEASKDGTYKRASMAEVMNGVARHLRNPVHCLEALAEITDAQSMTMALAEKAGVVDLQRATTEALAFIGFVKRFAKKET